MTPDDLPVAHRHVDLGRVTLHVAEAGPAGGPPVVLIHGFPETWWSRRHQIAPLAAAGFRVLAVDLRGFGASSREGPSDLDTLAGDIAALIAREVGGPAAVVGHDWGGATAWHLAAHHPERVSRLVVLNCPLVHRLTEAVMWRPRPRQIRRSWYMFFFLLPRLPERLITRDRGSAILRMIRAASRDRRSTGSEELAPFRDAAIAPGAVTAMLAPYRTEGRALVRSVLARQPHPRHRPPPTIACPALLLWGMEDPALGFDDLVPGTEAWVPRLEVVRLEGVGHFPQSERPDLVNPALLAFLARG